MPIYQGWKLTHQMVSQIRWIYLRYPPLKEPVWTIWKGDALSKKGNLKKGDKPSMYPIQSRPIRFDYHQLSQPSTTRGFKVQSGNIFPTKEKPSVPFFCPIALWKCLPVLRKPPVLQHLRSQLIFLFVFLCVFFQGSLLQSLPAVITTKRKLVWFLKTALIVSELKSQQFWGTVFFIISTQQPVLLCPPQTVVSW